MNVGFLQFSSHHIEILPPRGSFWERFWVKAQNTLPLARLPCTRFPALWITKQDAGAPNTKQCQAMQIKKPEKGVRIPVVLHSFYNLLYPSISFYGKCAGCFAVCRFGSGSNVDLDKDSTVGQQQLLGSCQNFSIDGKNRYVWHLGCENAEWHLIWLWLEVHL
jgi:hypothetical protein